MADKKGGTDENVGTWIFFVVVMVLAAIIKGDFDLPAILLVAGFLFVLLVIWKI